MLRRVIAFAARRASRIRDELGQTTAEYALVILGAAAVATLLITWATRSHAVGKLFDEVIGKVLR
jgi:Flp pilus assembly pilin Flp